MRWSPEVLGDETGYKDPFLINQKTETFFTSIFSLLYLQLQKKQCKVASIMLLNLSFKCFHSVVVT